MKFLFIIFFYFLSISVNCQESNSLMTFSSKGPDKYEDGSIVLDGEYYALVWQSKDIDNISFLLSGISSDTNSAIVLRALPRAKNGHCQMTTFSIDKDELPTISNGGILKMYLLDTRTYEKGTAKVGGLQSVQASIPITDGYSISTKSIIGNPIGTFKQSILPEYIKKPLITDIFITNSYVSLIVKDTFDNINYVVINPNNKQVYDNSFPVTGKTNNEISFHIPCDKKQALFQISRK